MTAGEVTTDHGTVDHGTVDHGTVDHVPGGDVTGGDVTGGGHLTTGWEPDLAVDDTLVRRFVFSLAGRLTMQAGGPGGRHRLTPQAAFTDPASAFVFDNAVVLLQPPEIADIEGVVDEAFAFFPPDRDWVMLSAWPTPDLVPRGFELVGHPPFMMRPPAPFPRPDPPGLRIEEVVTPDQLADFERVLIEGYPMPGGGAVLDPGRLGGAIRLWVGYEGDGDGQAVAVSGAYLGHGLVEVEWVATLAAGRGRGFGAALVGRALSVAPDRPAVLLASDDGRPLYERLGFVPIHRCTVWARPGPVVTQS